MSSHKFHSLHFVIYTLHQKLFQIRLQTLTKIIYNLYNIYNNIIILLLNEPSLANVPFSRKESGLVRSPYCLYEFVWF
jgi:hypothetical protein